MITDYDSWREGEEPDVAEIVERLNANAGTARRLIVELARALPPERQPSPIDRALDQAVMTAPEARDPAMAARLDAICGRILRG
jgi:5'-methylthioadenosine phosphorylase